MNTVTSIAHKRDGHELSQEQMKALMDGYVQGRIPDYQMAAWLMAVYLQGMSERETADLTMAMAESGDTIDLSMIPGVKVDKHSTGGVGDTTTLVLGPLVAACGVPVAKMSGRGLGHTGGTIDKLESIPGFHTELSGERFIHQVRKIGIAIAGQTADIAPADKMLYALRDVTATVDSIPLIASSIMSKKIAAGADAIVLDVKVGDGAFMNTLDDAVRLAETMVAIGKRVGRHTIAVISNMDEPLGRAIGNALEVREAIETLQGQGPADLRQLCLTLGAHMLVASGQADAETKAHAQLEHLLDNGQALDKFKSWVRAQDGDDQVALTPDLLPQARHIRPVYAAASGYVSAIAAKQIGRSAMMLGAGRQTKESVIDPAVGIVLHKKVGDPVQAGDVLAQLHINRETEKADEVAKQVADAYEFTEQAVEQVDAVRAIVTAEGVQYTER